MSQRETEPRHPPESFRCSVEGCEQGRRYPRAPGGPHEVCREHAPLPYPDGPWSEEQEVTLEVGLGVRPGRKSGPPAEQ